MTILTAWTPLRIGDCLLEHRIVLAPLIRNRATPSLRYPQTWFPNTLMLEYYTERATRGGLLISEATPVSLRASGLPGVPGTFTDEQREGWKPIVDAVHERGGFFFLQIWHQGRNTHSVLTGSTPESSSAVALTSSFAWAGYEARPFETPQAMTLEQIKQTQLDFVQAAQNAISCGFDGVEIHAGNGYIFDQFHHTNINQRTDQYGGSIQNRCRFTLETVKAIGEAIGYKKLAVRLTPFGLFNESLGEERIEQWTYLCSQMSNLGLAYVHLIEPRFDEFRSQKEKLAHLSMSSGEEVTLKPFRCALGSTPLVVAGGYGPGNFEQGISAGDYSAVAFGRFYTSNPDLVDRLRTNKPLYKWDRTRFYGPFSDDNALGYVSHSDRRFAEANDNMKAQMAA